MTQFWRMITTYYLSVLPIARGDIGVMSNILYVMAGEQTKTYILQSIGESWARNTREGHWLMSQFW